MIRPYSLIDAMILTAPVLFYTAFFLCDALMNITTWRGPVGVAFGLFGVAMLLRIWSLLWVVP